MGTRSIIIIRDKNESLRLYKHYDGYPTGVFPVLLASLKTPMVGLTARNTAETMALIAPGMESKVVIEDETRRFNQAFLGDQFDLEWIYIVNLDTKDVSVYGGGFSGDAPQAAYTKGPVDPLVYADALRPEYQENERKETGNMVNDINNMGWTLNAAPKARKAKAKSTPGIGPQGVRIFKTKSV